MNSLSILSVITLLGTISLSAAEAGAQGPVSADSEPVSGAGGAVSAGSPPVSAGSRAVSSGRAPVTAGSPPVSSGSGPVTSGAPPVSGRTNLGDSLSAPVIVPRVPAEPPLPKGARWGDLIRDSVPR